MTQSKTTDSRSKQSSNESEEDLAKRRAGVDPQKSSHNEKTTVKAGTGKGAGGGAKQKEGR
jgi:hypothetical protein